MRFTEDISVGQTCSRTLRFGKMVSFHLLPSWAPCTGSRKRQVMSPTTAHVPFRPFTFFQLLRSQLLLLFLVLGLLIGTVNVLSYCLQCHWLSARAE